MAELSRLPGPSIDHYEWQMDGACREADPRLFFHPEGERGPARHKRDEAALAFCRQCPVLDDCRAFGIATREEFGVWGGLTETDRRDRRSDRPGRPAPAPPVAHW